jgi:hypothetical protein
MFCEVQCLGWYSEGMLRIRVVQWRYFVRKLVTAPACFEQLLCLLPVHSKAHVKSESNARKGRGGGSGGGVVFCQHVNPFKPEFHISDISSCTLQPPATS